MKSMKKILLGGLFSFLTFFLPAQEFDSTILNIVEKKFDENKNVYSFKYDLLSEILQVGLENGILEGAQNDVRFKSTIYGLMVMFDKRYEIDRYYSRLKFQRNFELGGSIQMNEDNRVNGFGIALKYAVINKRDLSYGKDYSVLSARIQQTQQQLHSMFGLVMQAFGRDSTTTPEQKRKLVKFISDNASIKDFDKFYEEFVTIIGVVADEETQKKVSEIKAVVNSINEDYKRITDEISQRPLLTFAAEAKNSESNWAFATLKLEFQKGLGFVKSDEYPWDLYLASELNFINDTLSVSTGLNRSVFSTKGGINHVLIKKKNNQSFLEVLGGFEYNSVFDGKYSEEKSSALNAMLNVTFRIAPNLYLPVELRFDPDQNRVLGLIRIKWDMIRDSE